MARRLGRTRHILQRRTHELSRAINRIEQARTARQFGGDLARQRAAGAMRMAGHDTRRGKSKRDLTRYHQFVHDHFAGPVTALGQPWPTQRVHRVGPAERGQFGDIRRNQRGQMHQRGETSDRGAIGQFIAAAGNHHRVEDDRHLASQRRQSFGHAGGSRAAAQHADLDGIDADIGKAGVDLGHDQFWGQHLHRANAARGLHGDRGDRAHRIAAQHGDGLDICLDPRATRTIRTGD